MPRTSQRRKGRSAAFNNGAKTVASSANDHEENDTQCQESTTNGGNRENGTANGAAVSPSEVRVVGAKMSGVKHSGLLARDEAKLSNNDVDMETDEILPSDLNLSLETTPTSQSLGLPTLAGRDIYSITNRGKSGKNTQMPKTRKSTATTGEVTKIQSGDDVSRTPSLSVKSKAKNADLVLRSSKRKKQEGGERDGDLSDAEMNMEGVREEEEEKEKEPVQKKREVRRSTRARKVVSSSDSDLSSELSEDEELVALASKLNRGTKSRGRALVTEAVLEDYFTAHSNKMSIATSDHTLAKLSRPKMDQQSMQDALSETPTRFQHDRLQLYGEYKKLYPYWLFQIGNGFNVLLYGVGSKQKLLEDFRKEYLAEKCHLVVNGFFPGLTVKQVLTKLTSDLFGHSGTFKSLIEQAQFIAKELSTKVRSEKAESKKGGKGKRSTTVSLVPDEIYLIIHNIDGQMLRSDTAQTALSILAQSPSIHVIASVDHINSPLLWDQKKLSRFNWLWHDTTTYEPYRDETSYENSLLVQQSGSLALSSLIHVTSSLTPNARGIFELLVRYQLEHKSEADGIYLGMSFHECYLKCREKFLVSSDVTLRSQLTEFKDHKLVRSRKGNDGIEYLFIPVDNAALSQFIEQENEQ